VANEVKEVGGGGEASRKGKFWGKKRG